MTPFLNLLPLFLTLTIPILASQTFKALVAPITQSNTFFTITLNQNEKLILDIESPLSWYHCHSSFPRVSCRAPQCFVAQSSISPSCHLQIPKIPSKPYSPVCPCFTLPYNPITNSCASSELTYTNVSISSTNNVKNLRIFVSCSPRSLYQTLPKDSLGIASLSKGSLSLVSQFSNSKIPKKFGMCLGDQGVVFFGDKPFYLLPNVSKFLSFTSLLNHPRDNVGYYIDIKGISVNSQSVEFMKRMLLFDAKGKGGVKLSTITRYTTLVSHIYRPFLRQFASATSEIPRATKVAPFELCLNTTNLGSTRVGLTVPQIDLQLSNGANWTIFGVNSMIQVSSGVACLAFIDGGKMAEQAMVIGSYQMQHNFLMFDLDMLRLGFSPPLFFLSSTCNNHDFTFGAH